MRPILVTAYELIDESPGGSIDGEALAERVGRDYRSPQWSRDIRSLYESGYLGVYFDAEGPAMIQGTSAGRQETQGWPGHRTEIGAAELLLSLLERAADDESLPERESEKARGLFHAARDAGTTFVSKVAAEFAYRATGL